MRSRRRSLGRRARALEVLAQAARSLIASPDASATRGPDVATVAVRGAVANLVPGLHLSIQEEARSIGLSSLL